MKLPLYSQAQDSFNKAKMRGEKLNLGLYYQKFCDRWDFPGLKLNKQGFMNEVVSIGREVEQGHLEEQIERMSFLTSSLGGVFEIYELTEQFITGTGLNYPVEVGFLWNHTLGVPYLSGSSIKGLVRDWAENWVKIKDDNIERIFGSGREVDGDREHRVGSVIFFDALPYGKVHLKVDVMTPHYSSYYSADKCPGDWSNPTPIPFLTVDKSQSFIFFVAPRTKNDEEDYSIVLEWLNEALTIIGAGAKTATGYGCFELARDITNDYREKLRIKIEKEKRQSELARMSRVRQEMENNRCSTDEK